MAKAQKSQIIVGLLVLFCWKPLRAQDALDTESVYNAPAPTAQTQTPPKQPDEISVDDAPPKEAPYPGAADSEFSQPDEAKPQAQQEAKPQVQQEAKPQPQESPPPQETVASPPVEPKKNNFDSTGVDPGGDGSYKKGYHLEPHPQAAKGLIRIEKDGTYVYRTKPSPQTGTVGVKFGALSPPKITAVNGLIFKDIYGGGSVPIVLVDYEWLPFESFGKLGLQVGSGLITASGKGRFKLPRDDRPEETYTLYVFPNHLDAIYKFQYSNKQLFVPYLTGGGMYFGLFELRDDQTVPKMAGSTAVTGSAGMLFSLSRLDKIAGSTLDIEYGINNAWVTLEARYILGLKKTYDFTSTVLVGGLTLDF